MEKTNNNEKMVMTMTRTELVNILGLITTPETKVITINVVDEEYDKEDYEDEYSD